MKEKILVVIPYFKEGAQGNELKYAIAGWRKHFKEDFKIVIVGDYHPVVETGDDIEFIECKRVPPQPRENYRPHIDHVHKFRTVYQHYPDSKGFIYTCDDIYAVKDFTLEDVKRPKVRCKTILGSLRHRNKWVVDNYRTKLILKGKSLPAMNWVCHLPVYYDWDKLFSIYNKYQCDTKSRVVEQLYFNTYYSNSDYIVIEEQPNDYQFKVWSKDVSEDDIKEAMKTKYWICNSIKGWSPTLEKILDNYYN